MSIAGSNTSHGTHSRSPSRSPPPFSSGRFPPRYTSRYDTYNYRPGRNSMPMPPDDMRDMRDRNRERERDRERSMSLMREDRYLPRGRERDDRYPSYYRDDVSSRPPSPYNYPPPSSSMQRDYRKPSSPPLRREGGSSSGSLDRAKPPPLDMRSTSPVGSRERDDLRTASLDSYPPRFADWRERERDRRFREDDRRDRRAPPDRESYGMRDARYERSPYTAPLPGHPLTYPGPPPHSGDSYRPERSRPPSPGPYSYYDRERFDERDGYRPPARGGPPEPDRYRSRSLRMGERPWGPPSAGWADSRGRERPREDVKSPKAQDTLAASTSTESTEQAATQDAPVKQEPEDDAMHVDSNEVQRPQDAPLNPSMDRDPSATTSMNEEHKESLGQDQTMDHWDKSSPKMQERHVATQNHETVEKEEIVVRASADIEAISESEQDSLTMPTQSTPSANTSSIAMEDTKQDAPVSNNAMTQQQIVERIDQIENDITMYEEMLEELAKRKENGTAEESKRQDKQDNEDDANAERRARAEEEAVKQKALEAISQDSGAATDVNDLPASSPMIRKRPQLLINQVRAHDDIDDNLCERLLQENQKLAKEHSRIIGGWQGKADEAWSDEEEWSRPMYKSIDVYPCVKKNEQDFGKMKTVIAGTLAARNKALQKKERMLKKEFKRLYDEWKAKNLALDRLRENGRRISEKYGQRSASRRRTEGEPEEYIDDVIFTGDHDALLFRKTDGTSTPFGRGKGPWTSDTARSEAELLEIIQSLESAEMRDPELRAAKTSAQIPPMILDARERMRTFDDCSGLIDDPLAYYHTGSSSGDVWTQKEMTAFMESYMQYPKQFDKVSAAVSTKTAPQCVLFYYRKKKKIDFKELMHKGSRGKNKRRDRLAAAIRRATGDVSSSAMKGKSKGSALMTDIGKAQVSRQAKEKESEKTRELRDLEEANAYWDGVHERRKGKSRTQSASSLPGTPSGSFTSDEAEAKRRIPRRKGRSPRTATPLEGAAEAIDDDRDGEDEGERVKSRWTERDKETAVEAFKQHGRNFVQVAQIVGTKTEDQCRNFYHNYKRKFGGHIFGEESDVSTPGTDDVVGDRRQFKSQEEDAAAALVDMFQMGGPPERDSKPSPKIPSTPESTSSSTARRRRARTSSGKIDTEDTSEWRDEPPKLAPSRRGGRTSSSTETRKPAYSSYWSVSERADFVRYLEMYGDDWSKIANAIKTKTYIQVRNFYTNNEQKMHLAELCKHAPPADDHLPPMGRSFESSRPPEYPIGQPMYSSTNAAVSGSPIYANTMPRAGYFDQRGAPHDVAPSPPTHSRPHMRPISAGATGGGPAYDGYYVSRPPPSYGSPSATAAPTSSMPSGPPRPIHSPKHSFPVPAKQTSSSAVTKVSDLLNNDEPAEPKQKSWETWFGA